MRLLEFVNNNVNKEEFHNFVHLIDTLKNHKNVQLLDDFFISNSYTFRRVDIDFAAIRKKIEHLSLYKSSVDLKKFIQKIGQGGFGSVYKVFNKETKEINAAKVSI